MRKSRRPSPPPSARWVVGTLEDAGHPTWCVGGAVRDVLAGRPSGDWDLATRARPDEVQALFRRTVPIGVEHGTVGVLAGDGTLYEVTTFRRDVETDGRHAVVAFADTLEEDLARRDFTINAVAWHALRKELRDPYHGLRDLERGVLRTVGEPAERFSEDWLRVLRGLRFAALFDLEFEEATWDALRAGTSHLTELSAERVRDELLKILEADPRPSRALELYRASGALGVLYPELASLDVTSWERTLAVVDRLPSGRPLLRLAALLAELPPRDTAAVLVRLRLSNVKTDHTAHRAGAPPLPAAGEPDEAFRRWLARVGREHWRAAVRLEMARARVAGEGADVVERWRRVREVARRNPPLEVGDLAIDGRELIRLGLRPGPRFGVLLERLLDRVLEKPERNRPETLRDDVLRMVEEEDGEAGR